VVYAAVAAKAKDMSVIALTGGSGGQISRYADISIIVPETETYKIQELHLPVYHTLCLMVEEYFFS
jgi:D-sedoheptulose 7-phosphate isomerase